MVICDFLLKMIKLQKMANTIVCFYYYFHFELIVLIILTKLKLNYSYTKKLLLLLNYIMILFVYYYYYYYFLYFHFYCILFYVMFILLSFSESKVNNTSNHLDLIPGAQLCLLVYVIPCLFDILSFNNSLLILYNV